MRLGSTTITLITPKTKTRARDNSQYLDYADFESSVDVPGCQHEPFQLSSRLQVQNDDGRSYSSAYGRVWLPGSVELERNQRMVINGITYKMWGQPQPWTDLNNVRSHWTVLVIEREG